MQIGKTEKINVLRAESNFDKACNSAYWMEINRFRINEDDHLYTFYAKALKTIE